MSTIFERIIAGELPADKVDENEHLFVIKDRYPVAPIHLLIIPKKKYASLQAIPKEELWVMQEIGQMAQKLATEHAIGSNYRLLTNIGEEAGQSIFHLHFHLIGGKKLGAIA